MDPLIFWALIAAELWLFGTWLIAGVLYCNDEDRS